jgi:glycosyltransferase involved in cell wall biosynthesis
MWGAAIHRWLGNDKCARDDAAVTSVSINSHQLLVDVSVIYRHDSQTGIQRVVRALLLQLLHHPPAGFAVRPVYATKTKGYHYAQTDFLERPEGRLEYVAPPVRVAQGDIFLGLDLTAHLLPRHEGQIRNWKKYNVKVHILVYDLLPIIHGEWFSRRMRKHFLRWLKFVKRNADSVLCISDQVCSDFLRTTETSRPRMRQNIDVNRIRLSGDISTSAPTTGVPENMEELLTLLRSVNTVLMVGTIEPRKGYEVALAAFDMLWQRQAGPTCKLVIVGRPGWKTDLLQRRLQTHPEANQRLFWFDDASDTFLEALYKASTGVLITSHAEGYGLPLAEASNNGRPVLARDLPVFRELQYPFVTYFTDDSPQALSRQIENWLLTASASSQTSAASAPDWSASRDDVLCALGIMDHAMGDGVISKYRAPYQCCK